MNIYNTIQKGVVGVKDAALWKGPHMTALKLAAVESSKVIKKNKKKRVTKASSSESEEEEPDDTADDEVPTAEVGAEPSATVS